LFQSRHVQTGCLHISSPVLRSNQAGIAARIAVAGDSAGATPDDRLAISDAAAVC